MVPMPQLRLAFLTMVSTLVTETRFKDFVLICAFCAGKVEHRRDHPLMLVFSTREIFDEAKAHGQITAFMSRSLFPTDTAIQKGTDQVCSRFGSNKCS